ncbi:unnamed protein product (macronuclear) [Paramecium tetraurelia]|uniref:Uncharacterized protein n=1 Tax=Paramecium tetraurelia TaxID=5888 RepID=A0E6I0_PARTE|nr:uncharacterized protein GSPATT00003762001 [Paramecium tetraurelia]CAK90897.1 unnamed protein product [Paramecium tetraurelia]|eukprot:XP_001458294.1 hypothetical protein (macronuclear) [Paramecium tetraurelia strain d4-2]
MINNQIYQPVEFIYSYTIGGKEQQHLQLKNQLPQKKRNLTEEERKQINRDIQNKFDRKEIVKKKIHKQSFIKINPKKYLKLYWINLQFQIQEIEVQKKQSEKTDSWKKNKNHQKRKDLPNRQGRMKDAYDKEYDKGKRKINIRF